MSACNMYYNVVHFTWDSWNSEHIKKHRVTISEAEEACKNSLAQRESYKERRLFLGETTKGRMLQVVCKQNANNLYVITARDMSRKERVYYAQAKANKTI